MSEVMPVPSEELERPSDEWEYAYVAGAVDYGCNFSINVKKDDSRKFGYSIVHQLTISNIHRGSIALINEFCREHEIDSKTRPKKDSYRFEIGNREGIKRFLKLIKPYLVAKHDSAEIMLEHLIPGLERGETKTKQGFIQMVRYVDKIREQRSSRGKAKYDTEYFKEEWNL